MKIKICVLLIVLCSLGILLTSVAYAQGPPPLSLKDSMTVAESALKKSKIDLTNHWLYSITFAHNSKGFYWYYTYRPNVPSEFDEFFVKVFFDSSVEITGGPEPA